VVTWNLLGRLSGLLYDVPTRLALAGLACSLGGSAALLCWASQHYVAGRVTGWRWTTWEKVMEAEPQAGRREWDQEGDNAAADDLHSQEMT
jgi:hypothetical protein